MANKQIVINQELHKDLKKFCADNSQPIKDYTETLLKYAIGQNLSLEDIQDKQKKDSFASVSKGGPMIRYSKKAKEEDS
jgi:hypothetical protein